MKINKKQVVMLTLALIICVAVYLNWRFLQAEDLDLSATETVGGTTQGDEEGEEEKVLGEAQYVAGEGKSVDEYFTQSRLTRRQSKDDAIELLKTVVGSSDSSEAAKEKANNEIVAIADATEKEGTIENLIKAKGFRDCVVFISAESVNVVVATEGLTQDQAAQITEIVVSETGVQRTAVKVVEIKS